MQQEVQELYDWLCSESPTLRSRLNGPDRPRVRLFVRLRVVEEAIEVTVKFFDTDKHEYSVTNLPDEHARCISELIHAKRYPRTVYFRERVQVQEGLSNYVLRSCVFDESIRCP